MSTTARSQGGNRKRVWRDCVVCGEPTRDRSEPYNTPRCGEFERCATVRDSKRQRPRTIEGRLVKEATDRWAAVPASALVDPAGRQ